MKNNSRRKTDLALAPYRALDLTDEKGFLCGKMLGDLGVDIIKIEKPGGDTARNIGPFYHDIPHPEKSLFWLAFNNNKRGITLNIESSDGKEIFKRLVKKADFVIESFPPGYMERLGLGYSELSKVNQRIVMTSITPFGQFGPYKDYKASDLTTMAMSSYMYLHGNPDRPPVRVSFPAAFVNAGGQAALGTMIAHYHREITGEGQHVDVSAQASVSLWLMNARLFWDLNKEQIGRAGPFRKGLSTKGKHRMIYRCKDGYVCFALMAGATGAKTNQLLTKWLDEEGLAPDALKNKDWELFDMATVTQEELDLIAESLGKFCQRHTKDELYRGAHARQIMLLPVYTTKDIAEDAQLKARDFWEEVEHPELGDTIAYPGAFVKMSETPCSIRCRAPMIGEHNEEIYQNELGFSKEELIIMKQAGII